MDPTPVPPQIVRAAADEALRELRLADVVAHAGESGRAREEVIRRFIRRFTPSRFIVDTGFIVDVHGNRSRQLDIVIARDDYHPILDVGGVKHFLVESVVGVIENKARIGSKKALRAALDNIKSAKALDRTGGGEAYLVADHFYKGPPVTGDDPRTCIWGAIVAQASLRHENFSKALTEWLDDEPLSHWPNLYIDVHRFAMYYLHPTPDGMAPLLWPQGADRIGFTSVKDNVGAPPLVDLVHHIADRVRTAATVDYRPARYFNPSSQVIHQLGIPLMHQGQAPS